MKKYLFKQIHKKVVKRGSGLLCLNQSCSLSLQSLLSEAKTLHQTLAAKCTGLPLSLAPSQRLFLPGGAGHQHLSSCPPATCYSEPQQMLLRGGGSFLSRNGGLISGSECWKYWDPDHPFPGSWDNGFKPREARWENLRVLPISLSPQVYWASSYWDRGVIQRKACHCPQIQLWSLGSEILPGGRSKL